MFACGRLIVFESNSSRVRENRLRLSLNLFKKLNSHCHSREQRMNGHEPGIHYSKNETGNDMQTPGFPRSRE